MTDPKLGEIKSKTQILDSIREVPSYTAIESKNEVTPNLFKLGVVVRHLVINQVIWMIGSKVITKRLSF